MLLNRSYLSRYRELLSLMLKYGRSDLIRQASSQWKSELSEETDEAFSNDAQEFVKDLEKRGPTFVKIGQLLSTRVDLLPEAFCDALSRLQDQVQPFAFSQVKEIIEDDLGFQISDIYARFQEEPFAAASLAQFHRATLPDGSEVVVKVQRPNAHEQISTDMEALMEAARFLDSYTRWGKRYEFSLTVAELRRTLEQELDFRQELLHNKQLRRNLRSFPHIHIPRVWERCSSQRVLTMEYIEGKKLEELGPLALTEIDGQALTEELFHAFFQQIVEDGFFHADPHPGNVLLVDSHTIALLDAGMVARVSTGMRHALNRLLLMLSEGEGEEVAEITIAASKPRDDFDRHLFVERVSQLVADYHSASIADYEMGRVLFDISRVATETGIRLPSVLTLLAKTLMHLDHIGKILDPSFTPQKHIKKKTKRLLAHHIQDNMSYTHLLTSLSDMQELADQSPVRLNRILEKLSKDELTFQVKAIDQAQLTADIQKIANRITTGLILAAMIVGAAMIMHIETSFTLFGYPAIAILLFLFSFLGSAILVIRTMFLDD